MAHKHLRIVGRTGPPVDQKSHLRTNYISSSPRRQELPLKVLFTTKRTGEWCPRRWSGSRCRRQRDSLFRSDGSIVNDLAPPSRTAAPSQATLSGAQFQEGPGTSVAQACTHHAPVLRNEAIMKSCTCVLLRMLPSAAAALPFSISLLWKLLSSKCYRLLFRRPSLVSSPESPD